MKWVTRKNAAVDRIACPWLIRLFIDSEAEFLYVDEADVFRIAREQGAEPYDVEGAEMGHVDGRCSFESIILRYGLQDARVGGSEGGCDGLPTPVRRSRPRKARG